LKGEEKENFIRKGALISEGGKIKKKTLKQTKS